MNPVSASSSIAPIARVGSQPISSRPAASNPSDSGFGKLVDSLVKQTNQAQLSSDQAIEDLVAGKTDNVQQVVMAVANAEMSFQLFMELRNKLIESYNELMRMQF